MNKARKFTDLEKEEFSKAKQLSESGDMQGALEVLLDLVNNNPASAVFCATLANTYWELNNLLEAEKHFQKAVSLSPKSEAISLGLFHCLWDQDKQEEAINEIKRFSAIAYSDDYDKIIKEINVKI